MNSFSQKASIILMTTLCMVALLRFSTFSNFEEDELEENIENLADVDDHGSYCFMQWSFKHLEIKVQNQEEIECETAVKNSFNY